VNIYRSQLALEGVGIWGHIVNRRQLSKLTFVAEATRGRV
jgi:hypothetical protein